MTTTTLRPNATIVGTPTGAASVHAALNDDSDSSYADGIAQVNLGTVAMSGGVTKTLRARFRQSSTGAAIPESSGSFYGSVNLSTGETVVDVLDLLRAAADRVTVASAWVAVSLTQAQVDGLTATMTGASPESISSSVRSYEQYTDLVWVAKPVTAVDAVTPDPYTASNIVPISWVNTLDSDGGAQTRYWLKVFTDAQYGAGGFDPETSTAFFDSGNAVSGATTANTSPLDTGVTYRAYVKVAQTVNGAAHWSAWDFDQFDVDVDTADILTVAAAGSNSTGSITVTVERDTGSEAWNFVEVERSIDNGTTWTPVRGATYVDATGDADTFVVIDYEVGNNVATLYRARATRIVSSLPITGAWVQSSPSASWSSNVCWLKAPGNPSLNTEFNLLARDVYSRRRSSGVFQVIGTAAPVVVSDVLSKHSGQLLIESYESADGADVLAILDGSAVVLVQLPAVFDVADFYAAVTSVDEAFVSVVADVVWRRWAAGYVEVDAPADPLASAP